MVYLDLVVLLNFLVDFLLLLGTNRLAGYPPGWGRSAMSAALGGLYAAACFLPGFSFLGNSLWRTVTLIFVAMAAFGMNRGAVQRGAVFLLLSMALGGIASGINGRNFGSLVGCAGLLWLLCRISFRDGISRREYVPVELSNGDKRICVTALRDTGNVLTDPLTGEQVLIAGADIAQKLLGLTGQQLRNPVETLASCGILGLRLVPYHSVGQPGGMLLARRFPGTKIGNIRTDPLVAFAPEVIGKADVYQMLTGGV